MDQFLQYIITGISVGMVYALIALGFVLIWKSSSVANLALGQIVLLSSWFSYSMLMQANLPPYIALPIVVIFAILDAAYPDRGTVGIGLGTSAGPCKEERTFWRFDHRHRESGQAACRDARAHDSLLRA
jgi:hypothetical protein